MNNEITATEQHTAGAYRSFVDLAKLLVQIDGSMNVDSSEMGLREGEYAIRINNQICIVSDDQTTTEENVQLFAKNYNRAFVTSINNHSYTRINPTQNRDLLFNVVYKTLGFLPAIAYEADYIPSKVKTQLIKEVEQFCADWKAGDDAEADVPERIDNTLQNITYEELFDCNCRAKIDTSTEKKNYVCRFLHSTTKDGKTQRSSSAKMSRAVAVDQEGHAALFEKWIRDHSVNIDSNAWQPEKSDIRDHLIEALELLVGEKSGNKHTSIKPESVRYRRILKGKAKVEMKISTEDTRFDENAYVSFEPDIIMTSEPGINVYKCPCPSCSRVGYGGETSFRLFPDFNLRAPYRKLNLLDADETTNYYKYAVGCRSCMEVCNICNALHFPLSQYTELSNFYGFAPTKPFLSKKGDVYSDPGLKSRLLPADGQKDSEDKISDYCECKKDIFWFIDKAYQLFTGTEESRVLRLKDMVFINKKTKEVVAAFSSPAYFAAIEPAVTAVYGDKEDTAHWITAKNINVFFNDFIRNRLSSKDAGHYPSLKALLVKRDPDSISFSLLENHLADNYPKGTDEQQALEARKTFLEGLRTDIRKLLAEFQKKLSLQVSLDGEDDDLVTYTSVYNCEICPECGGLYFSSKKDNSAITALNTSRIEQDKCDDICDRKKEDRKGNEFKGSWMTAYGTINYRKKGGIKHRYVVTDRGDVEYVKWQKKLSENILKQAK